MVDDRQRIVLHELFKAGGDFTAIDWQPFHAGVEICTLYNGGEGLACAALLRYLPGAQVPHHRHTGFEHIIVLSGAQADHHGEYPAGTLLINPPGSDHAVSSQYGCVVLAIWEKPVDVQMQGGGEE
jgi:anti-sigma factor ChrR (cupin superfamily)